MNRQNNCTEQKQNVGENSILTNELNYPAKAV